MAKANALRSGDAGRWVSDSPWTFTYRLSHPLAEAGCFGSPPGVQNPCSRHQIPCSAIKIPCSFVQELWYKQLFLLAFSKPERPLEAHSFKNSLLNSLLAGNLSPETSSTRAASSHHAVRSEQAFSGLLQRAHNWRA